MTEPTEQANDQSWEAFWSEVEGDAETEVICGVTVTVPTDVTLSFDRRLAALSESSDEADIRSLVAELYGADVYEQWIENHMTGRGFRTALAWGMARARGRKLTFREAYDLMREAEAAQENPPTAANRAQRRAASKSPSGSGGGPSKRTSAASTGSSRKKSRS